MDAKTKNYWINSIGDTVLNRKNNKEYVVAGVYSQFVIGVTDRKEFKSFKLDPSLITVIRIKSDEGIEKAFISLLENASGVTFQDMMGHKDKRGKWVEWRYLHFVLRNKCLNMSLTETGSIYGKDHATVLWGIKKVRMWFETDKVFRLKYSEPINLILKINFDALQE